jgi:hypothetical protein
VSVDDPDIDASHAVDSPPDAHSDDADDIGRFEEESDVECDW